MFSSIADILNSMLYDKTAALYALDKLAARFPEGMGKKLSKEAIESLKASLKRSPAEYDGIVKGVMTPAAAEKITGGARDALALERLNGVRDAIKANRAEYWANSRYRGAGYPAGWFDNLTMAKQRALNAELARRNTLMNSYSDHGVLEQLRGMLSRSTFDSGLPLSSAYAPGVSFRPQMTLPKV